MPKKKDNKNKGGTPEKSPSSKGADDAGASKVGAHVISQSISLEMQESYLDYAMSVITTRALPDVRDGLKPVHRRILYSMRQNGLTAGGRFRKSATVVGDVIGSYHPHGESAVYDALVKMAQPFSHRYPLIIGQGNFGSVDGDPAAAYRYTEAKMSRIAEEILRDLEKETVEWRPNYDGTKREPWVMPSALPNLLLNGTLGIAVGMATNIPSHNLREVCEATVHLVDNPDATTNDLLEYVKGPDFPTGGIVFNKKDIEHAYAGGKGGVVVRGHAEIVEDKKGSFSIIVTSIPWRLNKADLISKMADLVRDKKIEGIKDIRDESTTDVRIVIDLKSGGQPQQVLNYLYKHTALEDTFHYNMVALVDGVPQTLSLKGILQAFVGHRRDVVRRRTEFDRDKAKAREHILLGLKKALDHIDAIIKTIKKSKDTGAAHANLMKEFAFSDKQTTAILEMRLQKLAGLERQKVEDELAEVQALIKELETILASEKKILGVIKDELAEVMEKYGDDRRTQVVAGGVKTLNIEDLIPEEESILVLTSGGYIKRTKPTEYRKQKRGGVGVVDLNTKEEDFVTTFLTANTHADLLFFTDAGKAYQMKMYELPEGKRATKGKSIMNFLSLAGDEHVTSVLALPKGTRQKDFSLMLVTRNGTVKKMAAKSFHDVRRSGLIAMKIADGDRLVSAQFVEKGDDVLLVSAAGQSVRFCESDVREMGRTAGGVRAMKIGKGDAIVGAGVIKKGSTDGTLLVISEKGFGKQTPLDEYKVQKRGGSGIKTAKVTDKTGKLMASRIVQGTESTDETVGSDAELIVMSKKSQVIRVDLKEIPSLSRQTQGVRIMKLRAGDAIAALICL